MRNQRRGSKGKCGAGPVEWTPDDVRNTMVRAGRTIRAMPGLVVRRVRSGWPDYVRDWHAYDINASPSLRPAAPPPHLIDEADQAISWLFWITDDADRRIVAARMFGITWRNIRYMDRRSINTLRKKYGDALAVIARRLSCASEPNIGNTKKSLHTLHTNRL